MNLRKAARGQECTLRLDCCDRDPEKSVWCHVRRPWNAGAGMKPPDGDGVIACHSCHADLDGRTRYTDRTALGWYVVDAIFRTRRRIEEMERDGI